MTIIQIILIICGAITVIAFLFAIIGLLLDDKPFKNREWYMLWAAILIIPIMILYFGLVSFAYLSVVWKDGGFIKHYRMLRYQKMRDIIRKRWREIEKAEYDRITNAYMDGLLTREELPRATDGINSFEFNWEMGIRTFWGQEVSEIVYVERKYNERLNRFFQEHRDLRLNKMYKFVYLPDYCKELEDGELFHYLYPNAKPDEVETLSLSSSYPLDYLAYSEDVFKIDQGMFYFGGGSYNHGAGFIPGDYHPLYEGSDEEIIAQLDAIVKTVHDKHGLTGLFSKARKPVIKQGETEDYADKMFYWETFNPAVAKLVKEVKERMEKLREYGLAEKMLLALLKTEQKLSKLVVTRDFRIILPDYNNMEIKMEPLVKAVYLLFLRHPEGIVFKNLPDYRQELTQIYVKLKPYGINDRVIRSIEDVTNPLLNSINEKCARIRGAFIAQFSDYLARYYYIDGERGEEKKISLPRDMVIWETD